MIADCPLCGQATARRSWRVPPWSVARCTRCSLLLTWPRPTPDELAAAYTDRSYYEARGMGPDAEAAWQARALEILALLPARPRRVVDVGAGQGHLVAALRRLGIDADGVEPSQVGRDGALAQYGVVLEAHAPPRLEAACDFVTLVHSLEHTSDPVGMLAAAGRLLEPQGSLYVEVPNAASVDMHHRKRRLEILDLPVHLVHFSPQTLRAAVERAGFAVSALHLSNPDALEWLLARRAARRPAPTEGAAPLHAPPARPRRGDSLRDAGRRLWRAALPLLRRHFAGPKLQLLAKPQARKA